ncbi:MAG: hypothetical protein IT485_03550 [Gammaproteobacteria bacterium]|jgi:hypothetical protein|nr:hypothetical protein [Burkholderiales bacterium]MCC7488700.1 hypothetical protein [Gammaproteobacteria bacterium]MCU0919979.1 hypothetical protein [Burkholderiaceae bacterium]
MKRRRLPLAVLQALLLVLPGAGASGCAAAPAPADDAGALQVVLGPPPADAALLAVSFTPASIPDPNPPVWRALLSLGPGAADRVHLGQIALHPPGQPGRFLLRVPSAALQRARLAQGALVLVLEPVQAGEPAVEGRWRARADWLPEPRPGL